MDSFDIPAWAYLMLERIKQSDYAEIVLVVLNDVEKPRRSLLSKIIQDWDSLLYIAYQKVENTVFKTEPDAFESKDARNLLVDVPVMRVTPRQTKYSDYIEDEDIAKIEKYEIDVFIRRGFRILKGKILRASKHGIWSYHHGDNNVNRGSPAGFWEVFENHPVTGSILQILTKDLDNGIVLQRSYSATDYVSVKQNRNNFYWKNLSLLPRKLRELHELGEKKFFAKLKAENEHISFYSNRLYTKPKNIEFLRLFTKHVVRYAKRKLINLIFLEQWILMFDLRNGVSSSLWRFKKIIPPKDRLWADPHIIHKNDLYYIFLEELEFAKNKGHISLITMDQKGNYTDPVKVLEMPYHLSYPFVFEWNRDYYMIPESAANRTIEVYQCIEFPDKWKFHKNLMENITAVDTTLFYHQQKWWLFANLRENEGASTYDELFLFYADNPLSSCWRPHPQNPIISDVRGSRPAGRIFEYNGNIYRPSQNCSKRYGYGLKINQIVMLNEAEYKEKEISSIEPNWHKSIRGVHTLNHENRLTIIDGLLRRVRFP